MIGGPILVPWSLAVHIISPTNLSDLGWGYLMGIGIGLLAVLTIARLRKV